MKSVEDIKRFFQKSTLSTNQERHEAIFEKIQRAHQQSKTTTPASPRLSLRSNIMKNRITKFAAAAVIIIAVMFGINYMGGSPYGTSLTWADVLENIEAARTVMFIREFESNDEKEVSEIRIMEPYHCRTDVIAYHHRTDTTGMYKVAIRNTNLNKNLLLYPKTKMAVIGDDDVSPGSKICTYERLKKDFRDGTEKNLGRVKQRRISAGLN